MRKFVPIAQRKPLEKKLEADNRSWAQKEGWFETKVMKTSTDGFPDRFYARALPQDVCTHCGRGRVVVMEWKREGKEPTPIQKKRIAELRAAGVEVYVVDSVKDARKILGKR